MEAAGKVAKVKVEIEYLEKENELKRIQLEKEYALLKAEESAFKIILDEEIKLDNEQNRKLKLKTKRRASKTQPPPRCKV